MGWIDRVRGYFGGGVQTLSATAPMAPGLPSPSAPPFQRGRSTLAGLGTGGRGPRSVERRSLEQWSSYISSEVDATCDPLALSLAHLRRMDADPIVYLAEQAITGIMRRPDLYHVASPTGNKSHEAEVYEWLWPLLPQLLPVIARSFLFGAAPYVLDIGREDLVFVVPGKSGKPRQKTIERHVHYAGVNELWPGNVSVDVDRGGKVVRLHDAETGLSYGAGLARLVLWDDQYGELKGQAARRRAWSPFAKGRIFELLQARYLERTVHTPLLVYGTGQSVPVDEDSPDELVPLDEYVQDQLEELYGGGSLNMPSDRDANGNRTFEVEPLELPERSEVWDRALNRFDGQKLAAYLVPPGMTGIEDSLGGGSARVVKDLFSTFVERLVEHAAAELTCVVETVHLLNHKAKDGPAPECKASPIPDKKAKTYLEVFRTIASSSDVGARVDGEALLKALDVPTHSGEVPQGRSGDGSKPRGRPRDATGAREERREDGRTDEAGDDTGAPEGGGRGDE